MSDLARQGIYGVTAQSHYRAMALTTRVGTWNDKIALAKQNFAGRLDDLEAIGGPGVQDAVDRLREIDTRYFETPYFLVPSKGGEKGYALLREAVRNAGVVGIGKVTMRQTQHLAGIKVVGDALVLEIMRFAAELVDAADYSFPDSSLVRPQELAMAEQLVPITSVRPLLPEYPKVSVEIQRMTERVITGERAPRQAMDAYARAVTALVGAAHTVDLLPR